MAKKEGVKCKLDILLLRIDRERSRSVRVVLKGTIMVLLGSISGLDGTVGTTHGNDLLRVLLDGVVAETLQARAGPPAALAGLDRGFRRPAEAGVSGRDEENGTERERKEEVLHGDGTVNGVCLCVRSIVERDGRTRNTERARWKRGEPTSFMFRGGSSEGSSRLHNWGFDFRSGGVKKAAGETSRPKKSSLECAVLVVGHAICSCISF